MRTGAASSLLHVVADGGTDVRYVRDGQYLGLGSKRRSGVEMKSEFKKNENKYFLR